MADPTPATREKAALPDWDNLGFLIRDTDELYHASGRNGRDPIWDAGEFVPFGSVTLHPAAAFFSYGMGVFEGLKAFRTRDDRVLLFRHRDNARRFATSAERLAMAPFPEDQFVSSVEGIVARNRRFVPPYGKGALYVRPMQHAIEARLGIAPCDEFWVMIYAAPVGRYFQTDGGMKLKVLDQGRVAPGGTGGVKAMGNYAGGIAIAREWKQQGFTDVLYLDARETKWITETTGSNVFVRLKDGSLVTPPLDDQILAGVTRNSVIRLAREVLGVKVEERSISIDEAMDDGAEVFCTGTAYTVKDVGSLDHRGRVRAFDDNELQKAVLAELRGIQLGDKDDRFDWVTEIGS